VVPHVSPATFGKEFIPGKMERVYEAAETRIEAMQYIFVHELGHHLAAAAGEEARVLLRRAKRDRNRRPISRYAWSPSPEYFAESWTAYFFHRQQLHSYDPAGYSLVERILDILIAP
jgi:predicted metalloprotease